MAGQRILVPLIGVRIPTPEPFGRRGVHDPRQPGWDAHALVDRALHGVTVPAQTVGVVHEHPDRPWQADCVVRLAHAGGVPPHPVTDHEHPVSPAQAEGPLFVAQADTVPVQFSMTEVTPHAGDAALHAAEVVAVEHAVAPEHGLPLQPGVVEHWAAVRPLQLFMNVAQKTTSCSVQPTHPPTPQADAAHAESVHVWLGVPPHVPLAEQSGHCPVLHP